MRARCLSPPKRPVTPVSESDDHRTFEFTENTYFPNKGQPGGAFSNSLYNIPIGERQGNELTGEIDYLGNSKSTLKVESLASQGSHS